MVIGSTVDDGALFFQKDYNLSGTDFLTLFESKAREEVIGSAWILRVTPWVLKDREITNF